MQVGTFRALSVQIVCIALEIPCRILKFTALLEKTVSPVVQYLLHPSSVLQYAAPCMQSAGPLM